MAKFAFAVPAAYIGSSYLGLEGVPWVGYRFFGDAYWG